MARISCGCGWRQSDYTADLRIGPEILKGVSDSYRRLRNTMRFLLGNLAGFSEAERVDPAEMPELERYVLHRLAELDAETRAGYAAYDFQGVFQRLFNFATWDLSADLFRHPQGCRFTAMRRTVCGGGRRARCSTSCSTGWSPGWPRC